MDTQDTYIDYTDRLERKCAKIRAPAPQLNIISEIRKLTKTSVVIFSTDRKILSHFPSTNSSLVISFNISMKMF